MVDDEVRENTGAVRIALRIQKFLVTFCPDQSLPVTKSSSLKSQA